MIRVRFAPSPTGYLHIGNVRTALFNYLYAKKNGGKFILRIEDTDKERSRPEYEEAQKADLKWLGLEWDEGPEAGGEYGPYRQSERREIYQEYIQKLIDEGKAYYCYVTEEETEEMKRTARLERRPPRFDNRGRDFTPEEIEKRKAEGIKPTVRFKIENPQLTMHDLVRGEVSFNLDDMVGDFVIQRADGNPTFHLVVCIDDALMKVTHVIRGEDHLSNTPKHILLYQAMGFEPPKFGHLSLVHGPGGEPLSKRLESIAIRNFRKQGYLPQALANYISLLGWSPGENREIVPWDELQQLFDIESVSKSSSNYDEKKLNWVNGEHLRRLSNEEFVAKAFEYLKEEAYQIDDETKVVELLSIFQDNIEKFEDLKERLDLLKDQFEYDNVTLIQSTEAKDLLQNAITVLDGLKTSPDEMYPAFIDDLKKKVSVKGKHLMMPLRMALTGKEHGPEMKRFFGLLGTDKLKQRLDRALKV